MANPVVVANAPPAPVSLLRQLVRFNTPNPPRNERDCISHFHNPVIVGPVPALSTWAVRKRSGAGQLYAWLGPLGRVSWAHSAQSDILPDGVTFGAELSISGSGEEVSTWTEV